MMADQAGDAKLWYQWIGWEDETDTAVVLIARDRNAPVIWFNHRLVHGSRLGWADLWVRRRLYSGERFAVLQAVDLDVLMN
jgi:hypothetical protein